MAQDADNLLLTGVWQGLYTYLSQPQVPESHFTCVLIDGGASLSGTIHETMNHCRDAPTEECATLEGTHADGQVVFLKIYDGSGGGGQSHEVMYVGMLNGDRSEIEGDWHIHSERGLFSGRFLMIRSRGRNLAALTQIAEHVE